MPQIGFCPTFRDCNGRGSVARRQLWGEFEFGDVRRVAVRACTQQPLEFPGRLLSRADPGPEYADVTTGKFCG